MLTSDALARHPYRVGDVDDGFLGSLQSPHEILGGLQRRHALLLPILSLESSRPVVELLEQAADLLAAGTGGHDGYKSRRFSYVR